MSIISHFNNLIVKHSNLKQKINSLHSIHGADNIINKLKKQKLKVKERILKLQQLIVTS